MSKPNMVATLVALAALLLTAGARDLQQVGAPAPAVGAPGPAMEPESDLTFILSASQATFPTATSLQLTGVNPTVQFFSQGGSVGLISTSNFTNSSAGAPYIAFDGSWLDNPSASLFELTINGQQASQQAVLLQLTAPTFNANSQGVTFTVKALSTSSESDLKLSSGVSNQLVEQHNDNVGTPLVSTIQPGTTWTNVTLFIDANSQSLDHASATEYGWHHHGGYGYGGYGGYHRGWGWNPFWGWGK